MRIFSNPILHCPASIRDYGDFFKDLLSANDYKFCIEFKCNRIAVRHGDKRFHTRLDIYFMGKFRKKIYYNRKAKFASEAILWLKDAKERPYKICAIANKRWDDKEIFAY